MIKKILVPIIVVTVIAMGVVAYSFLKTPEEAGGTIEAIPITAGVDEPTSVDTGRAVASSAEAPADSEAGTHAAPEAQADTAIAASSITFEIVPAESEARFLIDEVLRGDPITVVGATDQVAGQFVIDPNDLSDAQVGIIQVNARTLATDNDFRNRAIKNRILLTDAHEFVTFTPIEVVGLDGSGAVGETYTFQLVGDLTVTGITRPVTFDVMVTATSEARIVGTATTGFLYTDFELFIPDAPAVDTVDDEVRLELEFVAEAV